MRLAKLRKRFQVRDFVRREMEVLQVLDRLSEPCRQHEVPVMRQAA